MTQEEEIATLRTCLARTEARLAEVEVLKHETETLNKRLEERLAKLQRRSSAETELRDLITENSPFAISILDATDGQFRYIYANPATCRLFHLRRDQILNHTDAELFDEATARACKAHYQQALQARGLISVEEDFPDTTGEHHELTCILTGCLDTTGRKCLLCFCLDRTAETEKRHQIQTLIRTQEELIARLRDERDRALAAEKARSFFFSTVSHDIRTPLNAIIGFSEMLKLGVNDPVERKHFLDSILVSGQTLLQLINDVLDLSKLEAGKMDIHPEPTDCTKLVSEIADSFRASRLNNPIEIRSTIASPMPILVLDPQRIRQILFNLVGNAVKFTTQGYVEISASFDPESQTFTLKVEDTGCGIPDEDQARITQPYVQAGMPRRHGGTGLGLAICKELVGCMGGRMKFASTVGKGSIFQVELFHVEIAREATLKALSATQLIKLAMSGPIPTTQCVLIVDDSAMNLAVLKAMLNRMGIKAITTATNGREALDILNTHSVDLVLTDMWMPVMDGRRLVQSIRSDARFSKLPVYAVTADVETNKQCADAGFTGILLKPLTLGKLRTLFNVENETGGGDFNN